MKKQTFTLNSDTTKIVVLILLVLNLLLAWYVSFFKKDALWLETLKAGGKENFALIEKLYNNDSFKEQQTKSLEEAIWSMGWETNTEPSSLQILDETTIEKLFKDTYIKGNENARFVIFEYSDLLCPFCQRHHNDRTLQKVQEKYPNDVALIFKNMPLVQLHPTAPLWAEAVECAGKIWGSDDFYAFIDKAFTQNTFNEEVITTIAKEIWTSSSKINACVNWWEFKSKIDWILEEARTLFGINGTPGNVILDKETGKYVIVNGAYPFEKFDTEVQNLMNQ